MNRRTLWALGLSVPAVLAAALALRPAATDARPAGAPAPDSPRLPVKQVALFSSGVGYFSREGEVDGDARVDLSFPVGDINDLIKSLTLQDLSGGLVVGRQLRQSRPGRADPQELRRRSDRLAERSTTLGSGPW